MNAQDNGAKGWPFLVGRGRGSGHQIIAAPDFLVERGQAQILESRVVEPSGPDGATQVKVLTSRTGGCLTVVSSTLRITTNILSDPCGTTAEANDAPVLDMHSRPLEVLYGFVVPGLSVRVLDEQDLRTSRSLAIDSYRRFLSNEDHSDMTLTSPFRIRSETAALAPAPEPVNEPNRPEPEPSRRPLTVAAFAALVCLIAVAWLLLRPGTTQPELIAVSDTGVCQNLTPESPSCDIEVQAAPDAELVNVRVEPPSVDGVEVANGCATPLVADASCTISVALVDGATPDDNAKIRIEWGDPNNHITIQIGTRPQDQPAS